MRSPGSILSPLLSPRLQELRRKWFKDAEQIASLIKTSAALIGENTRTLWRTRVGNRISIRLIQCEPKFVLENAQAERTFEYSHNIPRRTPSMK